MDDGLSDQDYVALHEFRYAIRRFTRISEDLARAAGIEPQQHQLMLAIKATQVDGQARISDLAERLQLRHHSTVELIDRLVTNGLAERHRAEEDRRQVHVQLTPKGEHALAQLAQQHREQLRCDGRELVHVLEMIMQSDDGSPTRHALRASSAESE